MSQHAHNETVKLTRCERVVLTLIIDGGKSQNIADQLCVSKRTVDFHLDSIYRKLQVTNRLQAVRCAVRLGLLEVA